MKRAVPVVIALALVVARPAAQDVPQVFRGRISTVPVYASVSDRHGGFVIDLAKEDFEIKDNGKVQPITQFTTDLQPLSTVILIDGSSSMMQVFDSVLEAASGFILHMLPADRTAIASFADIFQMRQPFTSNRDELVAHLGNQFNIRVAGETRLWEAVTESVLALSKETGRRVVIVLTDGKEWTAAQGSLGQPVNRQPFLTEAPYSLVSLALSRDVMIYAIAVWTRDEKTVEAPSKSISSLAADTGGGYVEMHEGDDINRLASAVSRELHQQYLLGFTPSILDGKVHKLEVKLPKRQGLFVRARRSYLAPKPGGLP